MMLLLFSNLNFAKGKKTITIAAENDWAPYARFNGTGLGNEIIKAAFKSVNYQVHFDVVPYPRVLDNLLKAKNIAGFNVPLDMKTKDRFLFGKNNLYNATSLYYENNRAPIKFKNKNQIKDQLTVGLVTGYGYGSHILKLIKEKKVKPVYVKSDEQLVEMLFNKRLDAIILFDLVAKILLHEGRLQRKIKPVFLNQRVPIYLAFSKKHLKSKETMVLFDKGMDIIRANGRYDEIIISYLYSTSPIRE